MNTLNVAPRHGEEYSASGTFTRNFSFGSLDDVTKQEVIDHAKKFMILYISYAKSDAGIVLYVNY